MTPFVKICGITNVADAKNACDLGANFLGLIFVSSSARCVDEAEAVRIAEMTKHSKVKLVGVFKDASADEIARVSAKIRFNFVQCHGAETPEFCRSLPVPVIKALEIELSELNWADAAEKKYLPDSGSSDTATQSKLPGSSILGAAEKLRSSIFHYADSVQYILFDRPKIRSSNLEHEDKWLSAAIDVLSKINIPVPYIFAGGLNAQNVSEVICRVQPWVVDVASGVEREPGKKDFSKMEAFFNSVRNSDVSKAVPAK
jgi:phosphoribosylanthranilate isomerase